ncbi:hypothetical protein G5714_004531 [Onychostoma macrolepis]|uniref:Uncharacterized protein n=1 Tax=Onychostoma macrolepis TaxID=369639 RepID=A0A7J6D4Y1_9TELE|nr:hypothetical protein G5714_004531 [Onychostoma macrolepis]
MLTASRLAHRNTSSKQPCGLSLFQPESSAPPVPSVESAAERIAEDLGHKSPEQLKPESSAIPVPSVESESSAEDLGHKSPEQCTEPLPSGNARIWCLHNWANVEKHFKNLQSWLQKIGTPLDVTTKTKGDAEDLKVTLGDMGQDHNISSALGDMMP